MTHVIYVILVIFLKSSSLCVVLYCCLVSVKYRKMVLLTPDDLPWDPLSILTGDEDRTPKKGLSVKQNWEPFKQYNIASPTSGVEVFNVFQVEQEKVTLNILHYKKYRLQCVAALKLMVLIQKRLTLKPGNYTDFCLFVPFPTC